MNFILLLGQIIVVRIKRMVRLWTLESYVGLELEKASIQLSDLSTFMEYK